VLILFFALLVVERIFFIFEYWRMTICSALCISIMTLIAVYFDKKILANARGQRKLIIFSFFSNDMMVHCWHLKGSQMLSV
jgi:hypothetical protein